MDAVAGEEICIIMRKQEGRTDVDQGTAEHCRNPFRSTVVVFVPAVEHAGVTQPAEDIFIGKIPRDPVHVSFGIERHEIADLHRRAHVLRVPDHFAVEFREPVEGSVR